MNETSKMITVTEVEEKSDQKQMKMERRGFDFYLQREREWWVLGRMKRVRWVIGKREERRERDEVCLGVGRVCTMSLSLSFPKEG